MSGRSFADSFADTIHDELSRCVMFVPVSDSEAEERAWLDCDLASLAENRLGDLTHPGKLDDRRRAEWRARATDGCGYTLKARNEFDRCYWILDAGIRAGTLALATSTFGGMTLRLSSFYIFPERRGHGLGVNALATVEHILARHDLGVRLETSWCWQQAVRFYLARRMWVRMWKHDLVFCWDPSTPAHRIDVRADTATLSVDGEKDTILLARAHRRGNTLELPEQDASLEQTKNLGEAPWHAQGTLSLAIALAGWPLVRSPQYWEKNYWADAGPPESLAYKIMVWEAWNRKHGWLVETPRIAGLEYPSWDDFEARWKAQRETHERESRS